MGTRRIAVSGLLFASLAGCLTEGPACPDGEAIVELGGGREAFEPFVGGELLVELGVAGGWVSWVSLRARGIYPGDPDDIERYYADRPDYTVTGKPDQPEARYRLTRLTGDELGRGLSVAPMLPIGGELLERTGDPVVLSPFLGEEIDGAQVLLTVTLEDGCGKTATAEEALTVTVVPWDQ